MAALENSCTLCQAPVLQFKFTDQQDQFFCCAGCQTVYQILKAKDDLTEIHENPIFKNAVLSGLITRPFKKAELDESLVHENQKFALVIQDMWCPSCAKLIELLLLKEKGMYRCLVDYATDLAVIEYSPRYLSKEKIIRLIKQLGYTPSSLDDPRQKKMSRTLLLRFIIAAFFSLNIMMFAYPLYAAYFEGDPENYSELFVWLSFAGSLPVLTYCAWPIWRRCWNGLKTGLWGMELLVCLGVTAATGLSIYEMLQHSSLIYFDSMTVIIVFVLLGKILESRAKFSAKDALVKLSWALPRRGRKLFENQLEQFIPIKDFQVDDLLVTKMGEKIVLDGCIVQGEGHCDESLMTGEAIPIVKKVGDLVLAGSFLQQGQLTIKVTSCAEESALQKIVQMIEQNIENKPLEQPLIDKVIRWFIPFVLTAAFLTFCFNLAFSIVDPGKNELQTALIRFVAVLLISCPCAIGIAAPLAEAQVLNALAKKGILIRNRRSLHFIGRITHAIFDKTGTVTEGKFIVRNGLSDLSEEELQALKSLTAPSNHPIAWAISQHLNLPNQKTDNWEEKVGKGIQAFYQDHRYLLGSAAFLKEKGVFCPKISSETAETIETSVYFAKDSQLISIITLGDRLRKGVSAYLQQLRPVHCALVSGDASAATQKVAHLCQFDEWLAGYSPLQKKELIDSLKKEKAVVMMLGDGINDAPALTSAHLSLASVTASDMSIQVSDILLTTQDFQSLIELDSIVKYGQKIIKQNIFWAFFYNIVGIGLAITGWLSPLFAAFAMVISSLIVLCNSQRIANHSQN